MLLPVNDAAAALGVSVSAVRRRLKNGQLRGQRQPTKQGHAWLVDVPDDRVGDRQASSRVRADDRVGEYAPQDGPASPQMPNLAARAQEMAQYSQALLAPYVAQIAAQAEEIGALKTQLAQERRARATAQQDAAPAWPERRSWWQRLVWG